MTDRRALMVVAVAGLALFALSFVSGWIVHDREIGGEPHAPDGAALRADVGPGRAHETRIRGSSHA